MTAAPVFRIAALSPLLLLATTPEMRASSGREDVALGGVPA